MEKLAIGCCLILSGVVFGELRFDISSEELQRHCDASISEARTKFDQLTRLEKEPNFKNTFQQFEKIRADLFQALVVDTRLKDLSPNPEVRKAADICNREYQDFLTDQYARPELFHTLDSFTHTLNRSLLFLRGEDRRLVDQTMRQFFLAGQKLSDKNQRTSLVQIEKRLTELNQKYLNNVNAANNTFADFSADELKGVSKDQLDALSRSADGKYLVPLNDSISPRISEVAENGETRRRIFFERSNRAAATNEPIVNEMLQLRANKAMILGYLSYAALVAEDGMAKKQSRIDSFHKNLNRHIEPRLDQDLADMLVYKRRDDPTAQRIEVWDTRYYDTIQKKIKYQFDPKEVAKYFPTEELVQRMLKFYQRCFEVQFEEREANVWAPSVKYYQVRDSQDNRELGGFYIDLYARKGKITKQATAPGLIPPRQLSKRGYQKPVALLLANLQSSTPEHPSFLPMENVLVLFHEFGHVMHYILAKPKYALFSAFDVPGDFLETPSQMLEFSVRDPQVLKQISGYYQNPDQKLPDDLIQRITAARYLNIGIQKAWQLTLASIDQDYHSFSGKIDDPSAIWGREQHKIFKMDMHPGTHPEASFQHIFSGRYAASYYGILWSEAIAAELFSKFQKEGLTNPSVWRRYRTQVLEPGATVDPDYLIANFLDKPWNPSNPEAYASLFETSDQLSRN